MAVLIHLGTLTDEGLKNVKDLPDTIRQRYAAVEGEGITLRDFYLTEGGHDFVAIVEAADENAALAAHLSALSEGQYRTQTLRAHNLDECDAIIGNMR